MVIRLGQIGVRFPLVADVVDALEEIFDVNRILIIFCGIEGRVLGVSCEVTCFGVFHATLDEYFIGEKVKRAKEKVAVLRWTMESKVNKQ